MDRSRRAARLQPDPARWEPIAANLPDDLGGASVLDVGGNSGYFTLQMKLRGAGRCVMVEPVPAWAKQARFVFEQFELQTVRRRRLVLPRLEVPLEEGVWDQLRASTFRKARS